MVDVHITGHGVVVTHGDRAGMLALSPTDRQRSCEGEPDDVNGMESMAQEPALSLSRPRATDVRVRDSIHLMSQRDPLLLEVMRDSPDTRARLNCRSDLDDLHRAITRSLSTVVGIVVRRSATPRHSPTIRKGTLTLMLTQKMSNWA